MISDIYYLAACKAKDEALLTMLGDTDESDYMSAGEKRAAAYKALAIQPSPAALNEYAAKVLEELADEYNPSKYPNMCDRSIAWDASIFMRSKATQLRKGEPE